MNTWFVKKATATTLALMLGLVPGTLLATSEATPAPEATTAAEITPAPEATATPEATTAPEATAHPLDGVELANALGTSYTYGMIREELGKVIANYVMQMTSYGMAASADDPALVKSAAEYLLNTYIDRALFRQKADEFALLATDEQKAAFEQAVTAASESVYENYRAYIKSIEPTIDEATIDVRVEELMAQEGFSAQMLREGMEQSELSKLLNEHVTHDITVTEEEARTAYAAMVEQAKTQYAENVSAYIEGFMNGSEMAYTPEGVRLIKHVLLMASTEEEKASVLTKAQEIVAELAAGKAFEEAITEYNQDPGMSEAPTINGYPVAANQQLYVQPFTDAAMALAKVGDYSEPVPTDYGVHILYYAADLPAGEVPFETKQADYTDSLLVEKKNAAFETETQSWRAAANITMDVTPILPEATPVPQALPAPTDAAGIGAATSTAVPASVAQVTTPTNLQDLPGTAGLALFALAPSVTMTVEGTLTVEDEIWHYVRLGDNKIQGYLPASAIAATDVMSPSTDGVQQLPIEVDYKAPTFTLVMENGGVIYGELYPKTAPQSVGNFVSLANSDFYNGLTFHRVIPDFMIQGGDPSGDGTGGPGYGILGEFNSNSVENAVPHKRGTLSMARSQAPNSAGSQFFICVADSDFLDGNYATFGNVLGGMEVADAIVTTPRDASDKPNTPQQIRLAHVQTYGAEYAFDKLPE